MHCYVFQLGMRRFYMYKKQTNIVGLFLYSKQVYLE